MSSTWFSLTDDRKDPAPQTEINRYARDGRKAEERGTSTVFVNGRRLKNRSLQGIREMIIKQLQQAPQASK